MQIIKIGKDDSNDIYKDFKNDFTVSNFHCQIFVDDEGNKFLTDLDSTNGTFVNGNKISTPVQLGSLDIIRAGNSLVKWKEYLMDETMANTSLPDNNSDNKFIKNYWWLIIVVILVALVLFSLIIDFNRGSDNISPTFEEYPQQMKKDNGITPQTIDENTEVVRHNTPETGYLPYKDVYGTGDFDSENKVIIENRQDSHAVVVLYTHNGIPKRHVFVRKFETFTMEKVPYGKYYLRWSSGNDWSPDVKVGPLKGGFQTDQDSDRGEIFGSLEADGSRSRYEWTQVLE